MQMTLAASNQQTNAAPSKNNAARLLIRRQIAGAVTAITNHATTTPGAASIAHRHIHADTAVMSPSIMKSSAAEWFPNTIAKLPAAMFLSTIAQKSAETPKNGSAKRNASTYLNTTTSISAAQLPAHKRTLAQPAALAQLGPLMVTTKAHRTKAAITRAANMITAAMQSKHLHKLHLLNSNRVDHLLPRARYKSRALAFYKSVP